MTEKGAKFWLKKFHKIKTMKDLLLKGWNDDAVIVPSPPRLSVP